MSRFDGSWEKVKRAKKHVDEINGMLTDFAQSDFYTLRIEHDADRLINFLCIDTDIPELHLNEIALAIGDAAHNYRSALDHLWFQIVIACGGTPHAQTSFPIRNAADSLKAAINGALKEQQITVQVFDGIMSLKPYQGGNPVICGLHNLNIGTNTEC
jgi:hypothetical protein